MFKKFHLRLTMMCAAITIFILCLFTGMYLYIAEKTLTENHELSFTHDMDSLCIGLEQQSVITFQYLMNLEQNGGYLIYLWDNGSPFYFNSLEHHKEKEALAEAALERYREAMEDEVEDHVHNVHNTHNVHMEFTMTDNGEEYDISVAHVKTGRQDAASGFNGQDGESGLTLLLLSSRTPFFQQLVRQRMQFILLSAGGSLLLVFFAWFFTGILLKPIQENQRRQLQFVSDASHELRTPLTVIRSCNQIMPPHYQETIEKECAHMARLVEDMLTLTGLENHTGLLKKQWLEPDTLLLNLFEELEPLAREKEITFLASLPEKPLQRFWADRDKVNQVLMILIQNAFSYTPAKGQVTVKIRDGKTAAKKGILFQVIDNGIGIPDEKKKLIFQRFYRAESSRSSKEHYGLGLCIASQIMAAHRGQITVSDTPGGGSTFSCFFPLQEQLF